MKASLFIIFEKNWVIENKKLVLDVDGRQGLIILNEKEGEKWLLDHGLPNFKKFDYIRGDYIAFSQKNPPETDVNLFLAKSLKNIVEGCDWGNENKAIL